MSENKTMPTGRAVEDFLAAVEHPVRRAHGFALLNMLRAGYSHVMAEPNRP